MSAEMSAERSLDRRTGPSVTVRDTINDTVVDELGPLAEQAVHAVRTLIHQTRPAVGALGEPAQAALLLAVLAELTGMLPQLLDHLQGWLLDQHHHGRLRTDHSVVPQTPASRDAGPDNDQDADRAVHAITTALTHAGDGLHQAGHALQAAHQDAAHLAVTAVTADVGDVDLTDAAWGQR